MSGVDVNVQHVQTTYVDTCWANVVRQMCLFAVGPGGTPSEDRVIELGFGLQRGAVKAGAEGTGAGRNMFIIKGLIEGLIAAPCTIVEKKCDVEKWRAACLAQLGALGSIIISVRMPRGRSHVVVVRGLVQGLDGTWYALLNDPADINLQVRAESTLYEDLRCTLFVDIPGRRRHFGPPTPTLKNCTEYKLMSAA